MENKDLIMTLLLYLGVFLSMTFNLSIHVSIL